MNRSAGPVWVICGVLAMLQTTTVLAQSHDAHDNHAGHDMHGAQDPETGNAGTAQDPHAAHREQAQDTAGNASSPPQQLPPPTPEDIAAAFPELHPHTVHGAQRFGMLIADRLEWTHDNDSNTTGQAWAVHGWYGGDIHRVWLRSEGERSEGETESADIELLYGRSTGPWWDALIGVRHDMKPGPSQDWLAIGVQGLAPQKFEVAATAYLGDGGRSSARFEAEYDLLLSNRLILQPVLEIDFHGQRDLQRHIGAGIGSIETGLRLRYEITRRFAPYLGVVRTRHLGDTARLRKANGEADAETYVVGGFRVWF